MSNSVADAVLDAIKLHGECLQAYMRIHELESACRIALEAMQWDVGGEAIKELERVLSDCE